MSSTSRPRGVREEARIRDVRIVVPARDEERTLETCLAALTTAMDALGRAQRDFQVRAQVVLVLDSCSDSSLEIAKRAANRDPRIHLIERAHGSVGRARRDGVRTALTLSTAHSGDTPLELHTVWIASTDADSVVPRDWLVGQLEFADDGADLLLGTVLLAHSGDSRNTELETRWLEEYVLEEGHPHIHAANLGVRASTYLQAGEYPPLREHEDVELASAVSRLGGVVRSSARHPVVTSARTTGRTPGGFAAFLSRLCGEEQTPRENQDTTIVRSIR
ncbi:glycosyltransferase family 2 protein [Pseudoclavibacter sp. RFBA6]|uniref:glycosyltransferase n=1 Tax=Pseudoclavibacter sp. RFBA6 TaxID=2080573 RepID=UPI0015E1BB09|nr:glycosyltransferase [Pseudoclavibacter sp. RFBA6]